MYERDWTNFDKENFILGYLTEGWNNVVKKEQASISLLSQSFLSKINFILIYLRQACSI